MSTHPMPQAVMYALFAVGLASIADRLSPHALFAFGPGGVRSIDIDSIAAALGAIAAALMATAKVFESVAKVIASFRASSEPSPPLPPSSPTPLPPPSRMSGE